MTYISKNVIVFVSVTFLTVKPCLELNVVTDLSNSYV